MQYEVLVSRGLMKVETTEITVEAANKEAAEKLAIEKAEKEGDNLGTWEDKTDEGDWNYQAEETTEASQI